MDMRIEPASPSSPLLTTRLYDRRMHDPHFSAIPVVYYTHALSMVAAHTKFNVLTGQFHRLRRLILDRSNFCSSIAVVLFHLQRRGYSSRLLKRKLRFLLLRQRTLYASTSKWLYHTIAAEFERMLH